MPIARPRGPQATALTAALTLTTAGLLALGACKSNDHDVAADSVTTPVAAATPTVGAGDVTKTDAKAVTVSTEYELTDQNFAALLRANHNLAQLRARDPRVGAFLDSVATGGGSTDPDAGVKLLLSHPDVRQAIESAGISVPDYFVASIAVAEGQRYMDDPKAAPATPTGEKNAKFLRAHRAELKQLDQTAAKTQ